MNTAIVKRLNRNPKVITADTVLKGSYGDVTLTAAWFSYTVGYTVEYYWEPTQRYGDADGDRSIGPADVTLLVRYLAGRWKLTINTAAADMNRDGFLNLKDATLLRRYLAGGWGVVLNG